MDAIDKGLLEFAEKAMYRYGAYTNEERALPDYRDGFKPVFRRVIWAMKGLPKNEWIKTARVVGETLGKYHPHGDSSVQGAIETLIHAPQAPVKGKGNWGTMTDSAAAMRYTNLQLSKYGMTFIHPDYLAVSDFVPNYEDNTVEPVILPSLLPNLLFNGTDGIGVGIISRIPSYTPESVLTMMVEMLRGKKFQPKDFIDGLTFKFPWGGQPAKTKANRRALIEFYTTGGGTLEFEAPLQINREKGLILLKEFPPGLSVKETKTGGVLNAIRAIEGVKSVSNDTDKTGVRFLIRLNKISSDDYFNKLIGKIKSKLQSRKNYRIHLTERTKGENDVDVKLFPATIPEIMVKWLKWRVDLEARCLDYRIKREKGDIAYIKLLMHAIDHLDVVINSLRKDDPAEHIAKGLKITVEQANVILDLKVRQLSKMDRKDLQAKLAEHKETLEKLEKWREKPSAKVRSDFEKLLAAMSNNKR